ncbi:GNAT family N-acetyltransferase [Desulfosporosinus hippei]|uniref:Ribosomal protein S18 acetylase RimI n=1 Tax=Desulfosporosinus hippei DSM 8344 TaxID=1121419 RepID=A0A1G8HNW3_9FIRM|nr:GNAT family N-acetyltransferase [Desulfosporosinus hippei]SDI08304.1 Ribosomal protein S18 acetylase RimI [Desulfosporosinus hippei DSM 8344]
MSNSIIRRAESTDISALVRLLGILFSIESDFKIDESKQRKGLEIMLQDDSKGCIMVAENNSQVIGMCTAQILVSTAEGGYVALIEDLVVDKEHRGIGIGKELLSSIEGWAMEKGAKRLQLLADKNNISALDFYKSIGWNSTQLICLHKK